MKKKYTFTFEKMHFNYRRTGSGYFDFEYESLNDAFIVSAIESCLKKYECELINFKQVSSILDKYEIKIKGSKEQYIQFCTDMCQKLSGYISNIQIL